MSDTAAPAHRARSRALADVTALATDQLVGALDQLAAEEPRAPGARPAGVGAEEPRPSTPAGLRDPAAVLAAFPAPTVVYWNGPAVGAGAEFLLAADLRLAGPDALLAFPEVGLGELPCWGGTQRLPRLAGIAAALRLLVAGDTFGTDDLVRCGLAEPAADAGAAVALADRLARGAPRRRPPRATRCSEAATSRCTTRCGSRPTSTCSSRRPATVPRASPRSSRSATPRSPVTDVVVRDPVCTAVRELTSRWGSARRRGVPGADLVVALEEGGEVPEPGRLLAADGWFHPGPPTARTTSPPWHWHWARRRRRSPRRVVAVRRRARCRGGRLAPAGEPGAVGTGGATCPVPRRGRRHRRASWCSGPRGPRRSSAVSSRCSARR
ncbi:MAG: enoyl-CoA hydratase/isomerase family protein [Acidimicrobiia bacterium]